MQLSVTKYSLKWQSVLSTGGAELELAKIDCMCFHLCNMEKRRRDRSRKAGKEGVVLFLQTENSSGAFPTLDGKDDHKRNP